VLVLLNLPERTAVQTKISLGGLFIPLFGLAATGDTLARSATASLTPRSQLATELAVLRDENARLRLQSAQGSEALRENDRLRQLLGWQRQLPWKTRMARILARDPENWWRTAQIDLGVRDGIKTDLPVLGPEGLVGRIGDVGLNSSQVIFVGDPKCRVSVVVRETGENGVISAAASSVLDHRLVDLTHLPRHSTLKPGQTVYTSGLGGIFPAGIPVGNVVDSRSVSYGLMTEARVKLAADSARLNEVAVLVP
jgi:rod shape-determining protein MreC